MPTLILEAQILFQADRGREGFVCKLLPKRNFKNAEDSKIKMFKVPYTHHRIELTDGTNVELLVLWRYDTPSVAAVERWQSVLQQTVAQFVAEKKTQQPPSPYGDGIGSMGDMVVRTGLDPREGDNAAIAERLKTLGSMDYQPVLKV